MKRHLGRIIPRSYIGRSVLVLMGGTALAQVVTATSMPFVTRLYSPELIGVISIYLSFFNFWNSLLTWRYESALLITRNEEESHHVFRLGATLTLVMALMSVPVLTGLQHARVLGFNVLPIWAPLVGSVSLLGYGWFMLYRSWLLRLREVRVISFSAVARSGANVGARLGAGVLSAGAVGLFAAELLGSWAALATVRKKTKKLLLDQPPRWTAQAIIGVAARYKKFAQYELPSAAINQLAIALPVPMVGALYGTSAAGWFGLARLLYAIPNRQIGAAVGDVFQMELGRCVREGNLKRGKQLFYKFSTRLAMIGLIPLVAAVVAAPPLTPFIFGAEWEMMGIIVAQMAPWMYMALIVSSLSRALSVLEKQQWKLIYDVIASFVTIVIFSIAYKNELELIQFISFLSWAMTGSYLFYYAIIFFSIKRFQEGKFL